MKNILLLTILMPTLLMALASCSAPRGKTYAAMGRPEPIATGDLPPQSHAELFESQQGQTVLLSPTGELTVWLSSKPGSGYSWRLAEIPDPSVLQFVSQEYVPPAKSNIGQEKWVFQATGGGTVDLRLWYTSPRRERFGSAPVFKCTVSVEAPSVAQGPDYKAYRPVARPPARPRAKSPARPRVHRTTPDPDTRPFLEPVFRSSRVLLRNEHDGGQQQG